METTVERFNQAWKQKNLDEAVVQLQAWALEDRIFGVDKGAASAWQFIKGPNGDQLWKSLRSTEPGQLEMYLFAAYASRVSIDRLPMVLEAPWAMGQRLQSLLKDEKDEAGMASSPGPGEIGPAGLDPELKKRLKSLPGLEAKLGFLATLEVGANISPTDLGPRWRAPVKAASTGFGAMQDSIHWERTPPPVEASPLSRMRKEAEREGDERSIAMLGDMIAGMRPELIAAWEKSMRPLQAKLVEKRWEKPQPRKDQDEPHFSPS